jgi:AcrR family transcriptional regulator
MKPSPRRRPKQGGYARGDETRAQIIETALHIFGDRGFDQASTREIAAKAGVNPPALQYYFGSKEGLHRACAQYIIDQALPKLKPAIERANGAASGPDKTLALDALENLLDALTDSLADHGTQRWSRFIARGKHDGAGPGVELIREQLSQRLIDAVAGLLGVIAGIPATNEMTRLRTLLILGQIHWLHAGREDVLRVMRWSKLDAVKVAMIKQTVREHTRRALKEFLDPAPA